MPAMRNDKTGEIAYPISSDQADELGKNGFKAVDPAEEFEGLILREENDGLHSLDREELNARARLMGIPYPEKLGSEDEVIEAIVRNRGGSDERVRRMVNDDASEEKPVAEGTPSDENPRRRRRGKRSEGSAETGGQPAHQPSARK